MYEISTQVSFSAAHRLLDYQGPCENLHGHNWMVKVYVRATKLDHLGMGIDIRKLKTALNDILAELDHTNLNDLFEKLNLNPSSENIASRVYEKLGLQLNDGNCRVVKVEVFESPGSSASYFENLDA